MYLLTRFLWIRTMLGEVMDWPIPKNVKELRGFIAWSKPVSF